MSIRRSWLSKTGAASNTVKTIKSALPGDANQQGVRRLDQLYRRYLSPARGADVVGTMPRIYRPSAAKYRGSPAPRAETPRIGRWFQRLSSALPQRAGVNWEQFEQELYAPAAKAVNKELRRALPELDNRDVYSGIEGSSSWSQRAKTRAFSDAARILGELRSQARARRKEAELRQTDRERSKTLGLLKLASDMASREAGAKDAARMGAWRIGEQAQIQDVLQKGAAASDLLRTLISAAIRSGDAGAIARLVNMSRRALR